MPAYCEHASGEDQAVTASVERCPVRSSQARQEARRSGAGGRMRPSPPRVCFEVSFSVFRSPPIPPHATPSRAPPEPEVIKCLCVSLVCGLAKPLHCCGMILSKTLAVIAHRPEIILCLCASTPAAGSKCASSELTQTTAAKQRAATKSTVR